MKPIIHENVSLKPHNTFDIAATARYFTSADSVLALQTILSNEKWATLPTLILGSGSNILFTQDFPGLIIHNRITGVEVIREDSESIFLKIGAGENWHQLVLYCVENNYAGIENLSLIPGTVGAAPIQNIGAYGVELKDILFEVHTISMKDHKNTIFKNEECAFGYRDSIFKHALKNKQIITHIILRLHKNPIFHVDYGAIKEKLNGQPLSIKNISDAIIHIRQEKLPDPKKIGNAGSFFKNPIVPKTLFLALQKKYPKMPYFSDESSHVKIPAAWLIEQCDFKGKRFGSVGVHAHQALVLVNYGNGTGADIKNLSVTIQTAVQEKFGIILETEVHII